jgi:hypothetical protein
VSTWGVVFLGVIAVSTLFTAIVQIVLLLAAAKLVRRLSGLVDSVEAQLRPLLAQLDQIGRDASKTTSLAVAQVERVDALFGDFVVRVEDTVDAVQGAMAVPMREGSALLAGFRAVFGTLKDSAGRSRSRSRRVDDEDALFI